VHLSRDSREFAHWTFTDLPPAPGTPQVQLLGEWRDLTWVETTGTTRTARILVAGPDADPGTAIVLPAGRTPSRVRLLDTPEIVVREGTGSIDVS
jgi:hypothetical protein